MLQEEIEWNIMQKCYTVIVVSYVQVLKKILLYHMPIVIDVLGQVEKTAKKATTLAMNVMPLH